MDEKNCQCQCHCQCELNTLKEEFPDESGMPFNQMVQGVQIEQMAKRRKIDNAGESDKVRMSQTCCIKIEVASENCPRDCDLLHEREDLDYALMSANDIPTKDVSGVRWNAYTMFCYEKGKARRLRNPTTWDSKWQMKEWSREYQSLCQEEKLRLKNLALEVCKRTRADPKIHLKMLSKKMNEMQELTKWHVAAICVSPEGKTTFLSSNQDLLKLITRSNISEGISQNYDTGVHKELSLREQVKKKMNRVAEQAFLPSFPYKGVSEGTYILDGLPEPCRPLKKLASYGSQKLRLLLLASLRLRKNLMNKTLLPPSPPHLQVDGMEYSLLPPPPPLQVDKMEYILPPPPPSRLDGMDYTLSQPPPPQLDGINFTLQIDGMDDYTLPLPPPPPLDEINDTLQMDGIDYTQLPLPPPPLLDEMDCTLPPPSPLRLNVMNFTLPPPSPLHMNVMNVTLLPQPAQVDVMDNTVPPPQPSPLDGMDNTLLLPPVPILGGTPPQPSTSSLIVMDATLLATDVSNMVTDPKKHVHPANTTRASAMRLYRERLKANPDRYRQYLTKQKEYTRRHLQKKKILC